MREEAEWCVDDANRSMSFTEMNLKNMSARLCQQPMPFDTAYL